MSTDEHPTVASPSEEFVQLFTRGQRSLYLFILAQTSSPEDAEEILQNTNVVIWSKCTQFQPGTSFFSWAAKIASYEILKHRQKYARDRLQFSDEFVQRVAGRIEERSDLMDQRRAALAQCLQKLRPEDRELVQQRYAPGLDGRRLAAMLGRPANSVYQSLGRIRRTLLECINRQLRAVEAGG